MMCAREKIYAVLDPLRTPLVKRAASRPFWETYGSKHLSRTKSQPYFSISKNFPAGTTHAMLSGQCESPHAGTVLDNLDGFVTLYQEVQYVVPPSRLWNWPWRGGL